LIEAIKQKGVFANIIEALVKSTNSDGKVKSSLCKAHESRGMKRTYRYAAMMKDEVQHSRMTFYEAVILLIRQ